MAVSEGLMCPMRNFSPMSGPLVPPEPSLARTLPSGKSGFVLERRLRLSMDAEAHRDDRGRKMMTRERTLASIEGKGTKYWMMEKMAMLIS